MPSIELNDHLRKESSNCHALLAKAQQADHDIRGRYQQHERDMTRLSETVKQLIPSVPSTSRGPVKSPQDLQDALKASFTRESSKISNDLQAANHAHAQLKANVKEEIKVGHEVIF